jgi:hypothetical protein
VLFFTFIYSVLFLDGKELLHMVLKPLAYLAKAIFYCFLCVLWIIDCMSGTARSGKCLPDEKSLPQFAMGFQGLFMGLVALLVKYVIPTAVSCDPVMVIAHFIPPIVTAVCLILGIFYVIAMCCVCCSKCFERN